MKLTAIDPESLTATERYRLAIGLISPRPIAWVSTRSAQGVDNLAPFSFFNGVCSSPIVLSIAVGYRDTPKDTLANLRETKQAVVHLVPPDLLAPMHQTGAAYASHESEAEALGLELVVSDLVAPKRLAQATASFECELLQEVPVGEGPASLLLLKALRVHLREDWLAADGMPDPDLVRAPARLGNRAYLSADGWQVKHLKRQEL